MMWLNQLQTSLRLHAEMVERQQQLIEQLGHANLTQETQDLISQVLLMPFLKS